MASEAVREMAERLAGEGVPVEEFTQWLADQVDPVEAAQETVIRSPEGVVLATITEVSGDFASRRRQAIPGPDAAPFDHRPDRCWRCDARAGEGDVGLCPPCLGDLRGVST